MNNIGAITKLKENSCHCEKCVAMCKHAVCLGTPEDIERLFEAGYGDRLEKTIWAAGLKIGIPLMQMVQPLYDEGKRQCTFLTDEGLCELHDKGLKPTEGKLANCKHETIEAAALPFVVAMTWKPYQNIR